MLIILLLGNHPADELGQVSLSASFQDIKRIKILSGYSIAKRRLCLPVLTCYSETMCRVPPTLVPTPRILRPRGLNDMPLGGHVSFSVARPRKVVCCARTHTHAHKAIRNFLSNVSRARQQRSVIEPRRCPSHESRSSSSANVTSRARWNLRDYHPRCTAE